VASPLIPCDRERCGGEERRCGGGGISPWVGCKAMARTPGGGGETCRPPRADNDVRAARDR
jgi:hypothetical protein